MTDLIINVESPNFDLMTIILYWFYFLFILFSPGVNAPYKATCPVVDYAFFRLSFKCNVDSRAQNCDRLSNRPDVRAKLTTW